MSNFESPTTGILTNMLFYLDEYFLNIVAFFCNHYGYYGYHKDINLIYY